MTDGYVTTRGGRYVLPVQRSIKSRSAGSVVDTSASGTTVFIEPAGGNRRACGHELDGIRARSARTRKCAVFLYTLSAQVAEEAHLAIRSNMKLMRELGRAVCQGQALRGDARQRGGDRRRAQAGDQ